MAEDLELKMNNLIKGYEQLDMISSKLPASILHMASKHTKNLLGDVEILTPKDREEFLLQQEMLMKARKDLQGMAYERVVIDVLTRDAILNAKRKGRHSAKPAPLSRLSKSSSPPSAKAPLDIDDPIPINAYPHAVDLNPHPAGGKGRGSGSGRDNHKTNPSGTTQIRTGSLPVAIQNLHTSPDNAPRFRKGKGGLRPSPGNRKYRNLNEPTKIPRVDKGEQYEDVGCMNILSFEDFWQKEI
jgi:hypothetical protein